MPFPAIDGTTRGRIQISGNFVAELGTTDVSTDFVVPQGPASTYNLDIKHAPDIVFPEKAKILQFDAEIQFNALGDSGQWKAQVIIGATVEWERNFTPGEIVTLKPSIDVGAYAGTTQEMLFRLQRTTAAGDFFTLPLTVENVGGALSNYPVIVDAAVLEGSEVEFYSDAGLLTPLDFWREEVGKWWVKIPSIGADTSISIYAKYGGTTVGGDGNGFNVFDFFDDFSGGSIHAQWDNTTGTPSQAGGILSVAGDGLFASGYSIPHSSIIQTRARVTATANTGGGLIRASTTSGAGWVGAGGVGTVGIRPWGGNSLDAESNGSSSGIGSIVNNVWAKAEIAYRLNDANEAKFWYHKEGTGDVLEGTTIANAAASGTMKPVIYMAEAAEFDHYLVRKDSANGIAVRPPAPTAYWSMDNADISGGQITDRMGNGLNLDINGSVTTGGAGIINQSFNFDSATSYLWHDGDPLLSFYEDDAFAVSTWIKTTDPAATIFNTSYYLLESGIFIGMSAGSVYFGLFNPTEASNRYIRSTGTINDGTWHHVICTKKSLPDSSVMEIYIDGIRDFKVFLSNNEPGSTLGWVRPVTIGAFRRADFADPGVQPDFTGDLDEMMVFRSGLNSQHTRWLYQAGLNGIQPW